MAALYSDARQSGVNHHFGYISLHHPIRGDDSSSADVRRTEHDTVGANLHVVSNNDFTGRMKRAQRRRYCSVARITRIAMIVIGYENIRAEESASPYSQRPDRRYN